MVSNKTRKLLEALFDDSRPLPSPCQHCRDDLPAYVDAELSGQEAASRYPAVAAHLAQCQDCSQAYGELVALLRLERAGQLEQPPVEPAFDLSFLQPAEEPASPKPWRLDEVGRLIVEFSAELLRSLQGSALQLGYLKSGAAAPVRFVLQDEIDDLNVTISAEPTRGDAAVYVVTVSVDAPSRGGWPNLAGTLVTLKRDSELIASDVTDAFGQALFERIAAADLDRLSFEIESASE